MKKRSVIALGLLAAIPGGIATVALTLVIPPQRASAVDDPREVPPIVRLVTAAPVNGSDRKFTGTVGARVQSNLGFRTAGKIVERLVSVGEQVKAGRPLMRLDETDLR